MPTTRRNEKEPGFRLVSNEDMYKDRSLIAFIIDGEVVEILNCNKKLGAILQSNPTMVEINPEESSLNGPYLGWKYDGDKFTNPYID